MQPDPTNLLKRLDYDKPLVAFYDAPDPSAFEPLVKPDPNKHTCIFAHYKSWMNGKTTHLTRDCHGCNGAGRYFFGIQGSSREEFLKFLVDDEGLKASRELMAEYVDKGATYKNKYDNSMIGPLRNDLYKYAQSITFWANPDQLAILTWGARYFSKPSDPPSVIAPFSSGCGLLWQFENPDYPQATIGATDLTMRPYIPADILAFTVNKPMFELLCKLDERSFLYKPFLQNLRKSRGLPEIGY